MTGLTQYLLIVCSILYANVVYADDSRWKRIPSGTEGFYYDSESIVVNDGIGKIWSKIEIHGSPAQLDLWEIDCAKRLSRRVKIVIQSRPPETTNLNWSWDEIEPESLTDDFFKVTCKKNGEHKSKHNSKTRLSEYCLSLHKWDSLNWHHFYGFRKLLNSRVEQDMAIVNNCTELSSLIRQGNYRIVGIDGKDGTGKSTIAQKVSSELKIRHINLDDYVEEYDSGTYVSNIKNEELLSAITISSNPLIIEGVCLLSIMEQFDLKLDLLVYVKKIDSCGFWHDRDKCDLEEDVDEFILKEKASLRSLAEFEAHLEGAQMSTEDVEYPSLSEEIIRYHYVFKPHIKADIIYENVFND